jgi:hypothetical protein
MRACMPLLTMFSFPALVLRSDQVTLSECSVWDLGDLSKSGTLTCDEHEQRPFTSVYQPKFTYSNERCMASIVTVYAPVFIATILFVACAPATLELGLAPWLAPWAHRTAALASASASSDDALPASGALVKAVARGVLRALRAVTANFSALLLETCGVEPAESTTSTPPRGGSSSAPSPSFRSRSPWA